MRTGCDWEEILRRRSGSRFLELLKAGHDLLGVFNIGTISHGLNGLIISTDWKRRKLLQSVDDACVNVEWALAALLRHPNANGRRGCPGAALALAMSELTLANLLRNFNFTLADGLRVEDLDMAEAPGG
ncbi:hypothetical protein ACH5RR_036341 [Cinchona calisaya]|uniref:Cytochrome P450 n=1 Tax=Cinchona calisaya TaxID=153742 RepID=A0ABD2Y643_9GENT